MRERAFLLILAAFLLTSSVWAQLNIATLEARLGWINDNYDVFNNRSSLYPEFEIGGQFFKPFLQWGIHWGFWNDNRIDPLFARDAQVYSFTGHNLGGRITFLPRVHDDHFPIPLGLIAGINWQFVDWEFLGLGDYPTYQLHERKVGINTIELGLRVTFPIMNHFTTLGEWNIFVPLQQENKERLARSTFKIGFGTQLWD